jgi:hypothetical protein
MLLELTLELDCLKIGLIILQTTLEIAPSKHQVYASATQMHF